MIRLATHLKGVHYIDASYDILYRWSHALFSIKRHFTICYTHIFLKALYIALTAFHCRCFHTNFHKSWYSTCLYNLHPIWHLFLASQLSTTSILCSFAFHVFWKAYRRHDTCLLHHVKLWGNSCFGSLASYTLHTCIVHCSAPWSFAKCSDILRTLLAWSDAQRLMAQTGSQPCGSIWTT